MLPIGHLGITLGTVKLLDVARTGWYHHPAISNKRAEQSSNTSQSRTSLLSKVDVRFLLLGSILPDIIDKPMGRVFFQDTFSNGRIFCHTLLFLIIIAVAGFLLYRCRNKTWLLVISFGVLMHLVLDEMWLQPHTLLWPLYGWAFPKSDIDDYARHMLDELASNPTVYIPEIIGALFLIWAGVLLVHRKRVHKFIKTGLMY